MKIFTAPSDLKIFDKNLFMYYAELFTMDEETLSNTETFDEIVGGNVNVLEVLDDLKRVPTLQPATSQINWKTLEEAPGIFDTCETVLDGQYVELFLATNNGGGEVYLIPKVLASECPNVQESILITSKSKEEYTTS
jgi:hypothetical protein